MTILGLDCSHWNNPDWSSWAARGYEFAFLKCTEGTAWKDPSYLVHEQNAVASGFKVSPYHYFRGQWNGIQQANHFFATASKVDMPPAVDVEGINNGGISKPVFSVRLKEFLDEAERLFGRKPIIYTSRYMWQYLVGSVSWAADYNLWVANYTNAQAPLLPSGWATWKVWQYTSSPLDQNRFNGSEEDFLSWTGQTPPTGTVTLTVTKAAADEFKRALLEGIYG